MEELLQKSDINYSRLKTYIRKVVATEMTKLTEPCYYPSLKKHYFELLHLTKLTDKDIKEFVKRFYRGTPAAKWALHKDPITNFLIFLMYAFQKKKDELGYSYVMTYMIIRYYTNLMFRQMKYCNADVFKYTLDNLSKTHLFYREKTIANALFFISKEMRRRYTRDITDGDIGGISRFIQESRTRISQSIKSFAEAYYRAAKAGVAIKPPPTIPAEEEGKEEEITILDKTTRLIDKLVRKITVYRFVDKKAIDEARKITKISTVLANDIANNLIDIKYSDKIRMIYVLFTRELKTVDQMCGKDFYKLVRSLMAIKRTTAQVYFKQQVNLLLLKVIEDIGFKKKYDKFTSQTQFVVNLYLAYYLTMIMRHTLC